MSSGSKLDTVMGPESGFVMKTSDEVRSPEETGTGRETKLTGMFWHVTCPSKSARMNKGSIDPPSFPNTLEDV